MPEACNRPLSGPAFNPYFALVAGVLAVSTGAIFARLATGAPALVIAAYRVGLATNSGVARELVTALSAGEGVGRLDRFPEDVLAVTRGQVMDGIREHLHPDRLVLSSAGDFRQDV